MMFLRKFHEFFMHQKGLGAALFIREGSRVCLEGDRGFHATR
jgi:hypothetical protein